MSRKEEKKTLLQSIKRFGFRTHDGTVCDLQHSVLGESECAVHRQRLLDRHGGADDFHCAYNDRDLLEGDVLDDLNVSGECPYAVDTNISSAGGV